MDDIIILKLCSSIKVSEFTFGSHISNMLGGTKQRAGQLYHCRSLLSELHIVGKCSIVRASSKDRKMGRGVILSSPFFSYFPNSSNLYHSASSTITFNLRPASAMVVLLTTFETSDGSLAELLSLEGCELF